MDVYVAADIEADGPIPGMYSMLSLGLAVVGYPDHTYYAELRPISDHFIPEALAVSGLDRQRLQREGVEPAQAMSAVARWVDRLRDLGQPVLVAAPAVFDGMFLHWYFVRYVGRSPFAVNGAGVDLRSYWMGRTGAPWSETGRTIIQQTLGLHANHTHHALDDARELAATFEAMLGARHST